MIHSLIDRLASRAAEQRDSLALTFESGGGETARLSYGDLDRGARAVAAALREIAKPGDTALLLYPQSLDFLIAFYGCLYAGVIAVPMFPPKPSRADARLRAVAKDSLARAVLTDQETFARRERHRENHPELAALRWLDTTAVAEPGDLAPHRPAKDDLAFLQYTSGSTGTPRGVMVSHGNLLANIEDLDRGFVHDPGSALVSWLPFYHDMGLIYGLLTPLYKGFICHLMAPAFVLQSPLLWLSSISRHRATHSGAPNFAYDLCVRAITPEQRAGLDLRCWKMALNGAEPVRRETLDRFAAAFRDCGFSPRAFCPGYGLAEATLKVTALPRDREPVYVQADRQALERSRLAPAGPGEEAATLVSCGTSEIGTRILIVHPETRRICAAGEIGEIWVAGETVAPGYWQRPEETRETFEAHLADTGEGPFLRTGDLGTVHESGLLVTGRLKDLLIFQGANHYPSDVEATVGGCHPSLRPDATAAFAVEIAGEPRLVIAQEVKRSALRRLDVLEVVGAVCRAVALGHDLQVHTLALLRPMSIPKTSSGKIQRRACRADYLAERLSAVASWSRSVVEPSATPAQTPAPAVPARTENESWLIAEVAARFGLPAEDLDTGEPLARYGMGSAEAVRLSAALAARLGRPVPPTIAYDHPTIAALASYLSGLAAAPAAPVDRGASAAGPIAVVGIGCRFPGAEGPEAFWRLLADGVDAVSEASPERRDAVSHAGRRGGFLRDVAGFDAAFFGISPHEAKRMDPQQRILLEVAWEALEHAGIPADRLAGSATGVFVGVCGNDYGRFQTADPRGIDAWAGTGNALSLTANRLSYAFDLRGPSLAVDTACSSSLVALHQACASLRAGECDTALAGGVNLTLTPHWTLAFSQAGMMAADGRCKTFDAAADGYGRGEGCGLVVLRRLEDAVAAGERVLAVIRGSAVNQDGRSNGLTAPSRPAQEEVLQGALRAAGVGPESLSYIEAHGTGTPLGDPIEMSALKAVLLPGRRADRPCAVGSVKTNVGHLEAAAGIAGVIKTVLALERELIPPHLHLRRLNEQIGLDGTPLYVPACPVPWPRGAEPRRAGVSSFGFGGTNAHLILEEAPVPAVPAPTAAPDRAWHVLALSARSETALGELAGRYLSIPDPVSLPDLCWSANTGRARLPWRAAVVADSPAALRERLALLAAGADRPGARRGKAGGRRPRIAFLFTGQGAQHATMGRGLYETQPVFRAALDRCEEILRREAGFSLLALLAGEGPGDPLAETRYAQPALFALQHALLALWRSWGVTPDVVFGHSAGEYAAAHAAGILPLEAGLRLLAGRGRLMQEAGERGAMATVFAGEAEVRETLVAEPWVALAAVNGPRQVVISGEAAAVDRALAALEARGIKTHGHKTAQAFHSPLMTPVAGPFAKLLTEVEFAPATLPLVADLSGEIVPPGGRLEASYWLRHLDAPVRFADGVRALAAQGYRLFLEFGPSATLGTMARRCVDDAEGAVWLSSLCPERAAEPTLLEGLAALHARGAAIDWRAFDAPFARRTVPVPTYPFERQPYWYEPSLESSMTADPQATQPASTRRAAILADLRATTGKLLEIRPEAIDPETPFLDLGADSIVLVGLIRRIEESYGVELPVRLFFEEVHCLARLAAHLEERASGLPRTAVATPAPAARVEAPAPVNGAEIGQLFQRQLDMVSRLIEQQIAALSGTAAAPVQTPRPAPPPRAAETTPPAFSVGRHGEAERELTSSQRRYVAELSERLVRRTPSSRELADRHRSHWADLRMSMGFRPETKEACFPIVAERSRGSRVWDREGNEYVDLAMGFGVNLFGHNPRFVVAAVKAQLERGMHVGVQSDLAGEAAARIAAMTGMERVTFCNSGTEAVMTAVRLARAATGRTRIVQFSGSYHGHADPTLAVARPGEAAEAGGAPMAAGVPEVSSRQSIVLPYGEERALKVIEAELPNLAAVLVEPVQSRRPDLQPADFLWRLRALTHQGDVPLLFDEVITGFRTHPGGAQAWFGIEADLATYGKVIGGGLPIGVVAGRRRFLDAVDGGLWRYGDASRPEVETSFVAGTFCKHPLAMAAALAVLRHLEEAGPALQQRLNERTAAFAAALNEDFRAAGVPIEVVSFASLFRFVLARNGSYLYQPLEMDLFFQALIAHGVYVWEGRTCFLSTSHTEEDLERVREAARQSVAELCAAGFFASAAPKAPTVAVAPPVPEPVRLPLSPAQRQLWMISRLEESGSLAYTVSIGLEISGRLDAEALGRALRGVVARHEALRTVMEEDGQQMILPEAAVELARIDLTASPNPSAALAAWWTGPGGRPFDLAGGPLFRAHLLALSRDRHVLALAAHHLVVDGWSMGIVVKDLMALYAGSAPAEAPLAWRDYLLWQERQRESPAMAQHEAYWLAQAAGLRPDLDLQPDHQRPARKSFRGERLTLELDPGQTRQLRRQSRQRRCTPFMALFAAWASFLSRRAGQRRLTLGIPTSGRPLEAEGTVGYCSHLLPVGVAVEAGDTFESFLARSRDTLLSAYQHQDYPFWRLLEKLALAPDPGRTPLFAATFNLERPVRLPETPGLAVRPAAQPILGTGFDLHLNVLDWDDRLTVELDFTLDLFTRATARRLLAGFSEWLAAALARPDERLASLPALTPGERHQALLDWNDSAVPPEVPGATVLDLVRRQAALRPAAPALASDGAVVTYAELVERAGRTASFLLSRGVSPGQPMGLAMPRSADLVVALLGILEAGAFYVPLDPSLPAERLAYILESSGVRFVATLAVTAGSLPPGSWRPLLLDAEAAEIARQPRKPPVRPVTPRDAAYLLYTSGSTGRPKGVVVEHGPVASLAAAQRGLFEVRPESRVLQFANLGFDASVSEIFVTLAAGATLCLAGADHLLPGVPLVELLRRERITLVTLPPSVLSALPEAGLPELETVVSAGEACTPEVVARWTAGHRLVNAYGPTEACVCATGTPLEAGDLERAAAIGRPIANVRIYLLDPAGDPVPAGAVGEIHIGGAQVARGYWRDPAGTAARFLPDPAAVGGRLYRTGDLARHLPDGTIEYLGRCDRQVKLRGIRVELGEVEQTLLRDPGVREAAVLLREGRLVAYLVAKDPALSLSKVRDHLAGSLAAAMIPTDFLLLPALPLSANGKVDRDRLPAPDAAQTRRRAGYVAPRTAIEETLAAIWGEVLEIDQVGIHDDFLSLGGHSLLSIQIASRIEEAFAVRVSLKVIFSGQTLEELAGEVEAALFAASGDADLEDELRQLENLSDDEVASLLAEA